MTKEQYDAMKRKYPTYTVLVRTDKSGSYYKTFDEDARYLAEICGIPLVYDGAMPTASFIHQEIDACLLKLIRAGKRVVICD